MVAFMKETYKIMKHTDKEHIMIRSKIMNIRGDGKMISHMVEDAKNLGMDHIMKVSFEME
jgi:hypothetical protein